MCHQPLLVLLHHKGRFDYGSVRYLKSFIGIKLGIKTVVLKKFSIQV